MLQNAERLRSLRQDSSAKVGTGYATLFGLQYGVLPEHFSQEEFPLPTLAVATNVIFDPHMPIVVNDTQFKTVHHVAMRHPRSNKPYGSELMLPPVFGVAASDTVLNHPQSDQANELISNLRTIYSPWIGIEAIARDILQKVGVQGLPPVIVIIATESDLKKPEKEGFSYGKWVSVVEPGTRIGLTTTGKDLLFEIVWGENVWKKGYANADSAQTFFTITHEIGHLLTLVALRGKSDGVHPENKNTMTQVLGRPIWEGLADCISGTLAFIGNEELYRNMNIGFNPKTSFLEQQQSRSLGNVTNYMNELLVSLLLVAWNNGGAIDDVNRVSRAKATQTFISKIVGRRNEVPEDGEHGWLVKKIFAESNFDWQRIVTQLKTLTQDRVKQIFYTILPDSLQENLRMKLIQEFMESVPQWEPFGEDSLS